MRVVAGSARGRRLVVPAGRDVRPTSDRVREAVFNALHSLGAIEGARVLDLFAGSGALAIEALSRGARQAVLVERDRRAREAIGQNLSATGFAGQAEVVAGDAESYLARAPGRFDLVLADPPYVYDGWPSLLAAIAGVLDPGGVVVVESDREVPLPPGWDVERVKRYGGTLVMFARPPSPPETR
ncbi:MAG: 16S rRNA (guanine(966)-N(2))-methyltransferase RsmD [Acidimicrobiales bacterium]